MYVGREMKIAHKGMGISESDWQSFIGHVEATLAQFEVPANERSAVLGFINGLKSEILD